MTGPVPALSGNARVVLYRLQSVRGNALYVIPSFMHAEDRAALGELEASGLVQICAVAAGIIVRTQAKLTDAGRAVSVDNPWAAAPAMRRL